MFTLRSTGLLILLIGVCLSTSHCRPGRAMLSGNNQDGTAGKKNSTLPTKKANAGEPSSPLLVTGATLNNSGHTVKRMTLRLDYTAQPKSDSAALPTCLEALPPDFEIGIAECTLPSGQLKVILSAGYFDQICYAKSSAPQVNARATLTMPGCQQFKIQGHLFDPNLRVDLL